MIYSYWGCYNLVLEKGNKLELEAFYADKKNDKIYDDDNVYNLWLSSTGMGLNNLDDSKDGIDRFLKRNPDTCFVMEYEHKIIGAIMAGNDGRRGYISYIRKS